MREKEILEALLDAGKVTTEEINSMDLKVIDRQRSELINSLHAVLCEKDHDTGECTWYSEQQMPIKERTTFNTAVADLVKIMIDLELNWDDMSLAFVQPLLSCSTIGNEKALLLFHKLIEVFNKLRPDES